MSKISVIICARNSAGNIEEVLKSVKDNSPYEIILIDGHSSDDTVKRATPYIDKIAYDNGTGLAAARKIGVEIASGDYVFFLGPDNVLLPNSLPKLKEYMEQKKWVCAGMLTKLKDTSTYLAKGMDLRWQLRIFEGERDCVGTPYLFKSEIIKKYSYTDGLVYCDDTDIDYRIIADGYKIGYSNIHCLEIGVDTDAEIKNRFNLYGNSDYQFYKLHEKEWDEARKLKSRQHGYECEYTDVIKKLTKEQATEYEPFFKKIAQWRVEGWEIAEAKDKAKGAN